MMNTKEILEFLKEYETEETCLQIEVNIGNEDITLFANNELSEAEIEDGFLTVFENTKSAQMITNLYNYLSRVKKHETGLSIID